MKTLLIAVIVAGMAMSCTDSMQPVPDAQPKATDWPPAPIRIPTLYLDVPAMGKAMYARPHKTYDLAEYNTIVGKMWVFSNADTSLTATVCWYEAQDSIVQFTGNIGNTTYLINVDRSTMNICHGPQETPVTYQLLMNNSVNLPTP